MTNKSSRWRKGCGIGCALVVLAVLLLGVGGCLFLKLTQPIRDDVRQALDSQMELFERFGKIEGFVPPAHGAMAPDRVERFLAVRETLSEQQASMETFFTKVPGPKVDSEAVTGILITLMGILDDVIEYEAARNQAMLDQDMGRGEYLYIYSMAYYSWLGHSPEDGPERTVDTRQERLLAWGDDKDMDAICGPRSQRRRWRRKMSALLDNQLAALGSEDAGDPWHERLRAEIKRFEDDPGYVPWQDGLPPAIAASLAPYRDRFEATYSKTCNCFEVPPT